MLTSSFFRTSSIFAFSVFITLPRNGKIAWKRLSRPCLALPPAESPSTKYNSFRSGFFLCAGDSLPERLVSTLLFLRSSRASSRALRAASRASFALKAFPINVCVKLLFSSKKYVIFSDTTCSTAVLASGVPNLFLVCPSNCNKCSGILIESTVVSPSRISAPSSLLPFLINPTFCPYSLNSFVKADLYPVSCVPPSFVLTLLTNEMIKNKTTIVMTI